MGCGVSAIFEQPIMPNTLGAKGKHWGPMTPESGMMIRVPYGKPSNGDFLVLHEQESTKKYEAAHAKFNMGVEMRQSVLLWSTKGGAKLEEMEEVKDYTTVIDLTEPDSELHLCLLPFIKFSAVPVARVVDAEWEKPGADKDTPKDVYTNIVLGPSVYGFNVYVDMNKTRVGDGSFVSAGAANSHEKLKANRANLPDKGRSKEVNKLSKEEMKENGNKPEMVADNASMFLYSGVADETLPLPCKVNSPDSAGSGDAKDYGPDFAKLFMGWLADAGEKEPEVKVNIRVTMEYSISGDATCRWFYKTKDGKEYQPHFDSREATAGPLKAVKTLVDVPDNIESIPYCDLQFTVKLSGATIEKLREASK